MWRRVLMFLLGLPLSLHARVFIAHLTHVSDGDTVWVAQDGENVPAKLRLLGIDAPEICQVGGVASREALRHLLENKRLTVTVNYQDTYGRGLARLVVDGQDVGSLMVQSGQAWSSSWRLSHGPYAAQEQSARAARRGVFALPAAERPSDFRRRFGSCYPAR